MSGSKQRAIALLIGLSGGIFSGQTMATWYAGVGGGMSQLSPDTTGSPFTLEENGGSAVMGFLGVEINDWLSAEAAYTDLGVAGLSNNQEIGYTAASVGGIAYIYRNHGMAARQAGMSGYVRLGLSSITNKSEILLNEADNTAVWIGAGIHYPLTARLGLRAEIASYDGDAKVGTASIYWRSQADRSGYNSGELPRSTPSSNSSQSLPDTDVAQVEPFDGYDNNDVVTMAPDDRENADVIDPTANENFDIPRSRDCETPALGEPTDGVGCALFTGVVEGVEFQVGGTSLTPDSTKLLDDLALSLNRYPSLVVELQIHTEEFAEPGLGMQISRERVRTVARYLAQQGVDVNRLRARAFGSEQPLYENNSTENRRLNNRIALRVL